MIPGLVYLLCALTSMLCMILLYRTYLRSRSRLLLWSGHCFLGLAIGNALLFTDLALIPSVDLSVVRTLPSVLGFAALVWGFVWESQ